MSIQRKVHEAVAAVCPIRGIAFEALDDRRTWKIEFDPAASEAERTAAQQVLATFDVEAIKQREEQDAAEGAQVLADAQIAALLNMTLAQVGAAIDAAFSDPAQRAILRRMARLILFAARRHAR